MPYIVINGEVHDGNMVYTVGQFVPGAKDSLADMEAVGAVKWVDAVKKAEPAVAEPTVAKPKKVK
jgi:hypothetical protein